MKPELVREARALLEMKQIELARLAGVSPGFVCRYELTGYVSARPWKSFDRLAAIRTALEAVGVEFTNGDESGVKLRRKEDTDA